MFSSLITSRIVATLSALLVILVGCGAGIWQLNRADQKIRLGQSLVAKLQMPVLNADADGLTLEQAAERRILVRGRFIQDEAIWLDNRPRPMPEGGTGGAGQSGFYLMMPLKLDGQEAVLWVNRGWAPRNNENRVELPPIKTANDCRKLRLCPLLHDERQRRKLKNGSISDASHWTINSTLLRNFDCPLLWLY